MVLKFWMSIADFEWWIWHGCVSMECHGSGEICRWYRSIFGNVVEIWMAMGWSDGRSGLQCLLTCTLLKVIRFLRVGMSEAIKIMVNNDFLLGGRRRFSNLVCTHVATFRSWPLRGYWIVRRKTHPIGSIDGPSIRLGNIKKDSGCADNAGPVTCICHDERVWFILSHPSASQNGW
jgi:hypothetical protein